MTDLVALRTRIYLCRSYNYFLTAHFLPALSTPVIVAGPFSLSWDIHTSFHLTPGSVLFYVPGADLAQDQQQPGALMDGGDRRRDRRRERRRGGRGGRRGRGGR